MNILSHLLRTPLAEALALTLFHFLWQGLLAAIVLAAALSLFRSSRARYVSACAALFAMPLAFGVTLALSLPQPAFRQSLPGAALRRPQPPTPASLPRLHPRFSNGLALPRAGSYLSGLPA